MKRNNVNEEEYSASIIAGKFQTRHEAEAFLARIRQKYGFSEYDSYINGTSVIVDIEKSSTDDSYFHDMVNMIRNEKQGNNNMYKMVNENKKTKKLNESQLRNIVRESISEALSEIGDTPEGRNALINAVGKATSQGRFSQADTFKDGLDRAVKDRYGEGATNSRYDYNSWKYRVRLFFDGRILLSAIDGTNKGEEDLEKFIENGWDGLKTVDRKLARQIAAWCGEFLNKNLSCYQACTDWHTWAKL